MKAQITLKKNNNKQQKHTEIQILLSLLTCVDSGLKKKKKKQTSNIECVFLILYSYDCCAFFIEFRYVFLWKREMHAKW